MYIFYTSSINITKESNKKKKLHFGFIYDFKWRKVEKYEQNAIGIYFLIYLFILIGGELLCNIVVVFVI